MKRVLILLALVLLPACIAMTAAAKSLTLSIPMSAVDAKPGEQGNFYVVDVPVPADVIGKRLDTVVLEFSVDVTALSDEDSLATPLVGVYPLVQPLSNRAITTIDAASYDRAVPSARPVAIGQNRILRMDITEIVKGWMRDPSTNHGLVIGTLAGPAVGSMTLRQGALDSGGTLRVVFFYQDRTGSRQTTK